MVVGDAIEAVAVLRASVSKAASRGLTISIENDHPSFQLLHMEYYITCGHCFDAPKVNILPGRYGVGAFTSTLASRGTRGCVIYTLSGPAGEALGARLFIVVGWDVPLLADNKFFMEVVEVPTPEFPRVLAERKRIYEKLSRKLVVAGQTVQHHVSIPERGGFSVAASMATSSIANLKLELHQLHLTRVHHDDTSGLETPRLMKGPSPGLVSRAMEGSAKMVEIIRGKGEKLYDQAKGTFSEKYSKETVITDEETLADAAAEKEKQQQQKEQEKQADATKKA
ncbi:hypothetical protein SYNPS1DRAFT_20471 [Syncephalis pseudoplumigaleata]|uniref:Uncharacterized protein n=1 Tax=Syncephalis pseudoplumigaleata TaxID=1712513 RepID=A0A4P9Z6B4_9FUNG|nr:hypothetical protein SYNPS1DRAFT_20471 [Syncephalis pseudoplumigaleata]|eukprot:RKP28193.1 hypothetical protein SYNPS1DRAFT_20471 [Syncephalis pseudoplumigaleata]